MKPRRRIIEALLFLAICLFVVSYLFGFEPQIIPVSAEPMIDFSFHDYWAGSIQRNGDSFFVKILTVVAYPGAKAGRLFHNLLFTG